MAGTASRYEGNQPREVGKEASQPVASQLRPEVETVGIPQAYLAGGRACSVA